MRFIIPLDWKQIDKSEIINNDPTSSFTTEIQKHLSKLRKEEKIDKKTYYKLYPSDPISPRYMEL